MSARCCCGHEREQHDCGDDGEEEVPSCQVADCLCPFYLLDAGEVAVALVRLGSDVEVGP